MLHASNDRKYNEESHSIETKSSNTKDNKWCRYFTKKQIIIASLVLGLLIVTGIVLPPVLWNLFRTSNEISSFTNETASICSTTTCISNVTALFRSSFTLLYQFDGNTYDYTQNAIGQLQYIVGPPTYYNGAIVGQSIYVQPIYQQYMVIPYVALSSQSFTIEMWLCPYWAGGSADFGIFGQCGPNGTGTDRCFSLSIRNYRLQLSFDSMGTTNVLTGITVLTAISIYFHVAVVYDASQFEQRLYLNGKLEVKSTGKIEPFQGGPASRVTTTIMMSSSTSYVSSYFSGLMDHFIIFLGVARTQCQILNDGTLTAYFPFDWSSPYVAQGMQWYSGVTSGTVVIAGGYINQALYFNTSLSYFQAKAWTTTQAGSQAFSVSLWINPSSVTLTLGSILVHISVDTSGVTSPCYDLLGLTSNGAIVAQISPGVSLVMGLQGPILVANVWTHIALVYGPTYGMQLWINGSFVNSTTVPSGVYSFVPPYYITLGNRNPGTNVLPTGCAVNTLAIGTSSYSGAMDEFRLYQRELNFDEICVLSGL